jgi:hypothetical protein
MTGHLLSVLIVSPVCFKGLSQGFNLTAMEKVGKWRPDNGEASILQYGLTSAGGDR